MQHSLEQLQDGQHDVVDVAEPRGLGLLGVVKTSGPVHRNVRLLPVELHRTRWEATGNREQQNAGMVSFKIRGVSRRIKLNLTPDSPAEPPAESWQNSNRPSNTGQSSPTLTGGRKHRALNHQLQEIHVHHCTFVHWSYDSRRKRFH